MEIINTFKQSITKILLAVYVLQLTKTIMPSKICAILCLNVLSKDIPFFLNALNMGPKVGAINEHMNKYYKILIN